MASAKDHDTSATQEPITPAETPVDRSTDDITRTVDVEKAASATLPVHSEAHVIPDGGWKAWLTVVGAWFALFATFGMVNAFGVFQDYYTRIYLSNKSSSDISWIGSIQLFLLFATGFFVGPFFDAGYFYHIILSGSLLYVFSLFMLSLAQPMQYYQVILSQGVGAGIGLGCIFLPAVSVIAHHFRRKHAFAMGIAFSGTSAGGVVYPIMLNRLINSNLGFGNAVRATTGLVAGTLLVGNALMRTHMPARRAGQRARPDFRKILSDGPYVASIISVLLLWLAVFFPVFYIQLDSVLHGVDTTLSFYTVTILNAASIGGRLLPNFIADKFGRLNTMIIAGVGCVAVIIGMLGLTSSDTAAPIAISVTYGFASGALFALVGPMIAALSPAVSEIGVRTGVGFLFGGIGSLAGTPIIGAILGPDFAWWKTVVFSAIVMSVGLVMLYISRSGLAKRKGTPWV